MRGRGAWILILGLAAGCRTQSCDLVEAELRTREADVYQLRDDLAKSQSLNEALMRELQGMRSGAAPAANAVAASQTYPLKQITLGRQTSGLDDDNSPGDEALQVQIEPRDGDGHVLKAPGMLHIEALEILPSGLKSPISTWDLSPDELRRTWKSGLLTTGYVASLPWKSFPHHEKVRVVARFSTLDGRTFEADKDIAVRLLPGQKPKPLANQEILEMPAPATPIKQAAAKTTTANKPWWDVGAAQPPAKPQQAAAWRPKAVNLAAEVEMHRPIPIFIPTSGPPDEQ